MPNDNASHTKRDAVYDRHVLEFPASGVTEDGWTTFGLVHPLHNGSDRLAVTAASQSVSCTRTSTVCLPPDRASSIPPPLEIEDLIRTLGMLGVGRGLGMMPDAAAGEPPVLALLARTLVSSWDAEGCVGDPDEAMFEARERERARLDGAGFSDLLAALPPGIGRILDSHGGFSGERIWSGRFLAYALAVPGRSAAIAALGDLVGLVGTDEQDEDPLDHPDPVSFVLECIARWPTQPLTVTGSPTRADAAWLLERFSRIEPRGDLASEIPVITLRELLAHRSLIEDDRLASPEDATALIKILGVVDDGRLAHPRLARVLHVLSLCGGSGGYGEIALALSASGGGGAKGFRKGCERLFVDADNLRCAFRDAVLFPVVAGLALSDLGKPDGGLGWLDLDGTALAKRSAAYADEAVFGGRRIEEVTASALAWRQAGSPGQAKTTEILWRDIAEFGREASETLVAVAKDAPANSDILEYLGPDWHGPAGAQRLALAARDVGDGCLRKPTGLGDAERPIMQEVLAFRRPGLVRRLVLAFKG